MPFTLHAATVDDIPGIAAVLFDAGRNDPGFSVIYPLNATPASLKWIIADKRRTLENDPTVRIMVTKDTATQDVIGYGIWHVYESSRSQDEIDQEMLKEHFDFPEDANSEAGNILARNGVRKGHEIMGTQPHASLATLATSRRYQKQGAASMLVQEFCDQTDAKNLPAYVRSTTMGEGIYRKFLFEEVDRLRLELAPWKQGDHFHICMIRPARTLR